MPRKYDIDEIDKKTTNVADNKSSKDIEEFIDRLNQVKELDEQNPLEQAIKYRAVKQNPPKPGYMEIGLYKDTDKDGQDIVVSQSEILDDNGKPIGEFKRYKHDPFYTVDLNKLIQADITACPSSVGPMLIDMATKKESLKKKAFTTEPKRGTEFNYWWIAFVLLLVPGIITIIMMFL